MYSTPCYEFQALYQVLIVLFQVLVVVRVFRVAGIRILSSSIRIALNSIRIHFPASGYPPFSIMHRVSECPIGHPNSVYGIQIPS